MAVSLSLLPTTLSVSALLSNDMHCRVSAKVSRGREGGRKDGKKEAWLLYHLEGSPVIPEPQEERGGDLMVLVKLGNDYIFKRVFFIFKRGGTLTY